MDIVSLATIIQECHVSVFTCIRFWTPPASLVVIPNFKFINFELSVRE